MAGKRCEECGRFMALTDLMPYDDELDEEAALQWGFTQAYIDQHWMDMDGALAGFRYVQDQWECNTCGTIQSHVEGTKHYWNPESGLYNNLQPDIAYDEYLPPIPGDERNTGYYIPKDADLDGRGGR